MSKKRSDVKVWSWRQAIKDSDLKSTTKLVLLTLSVYMNDCGNGCYPSVEQLVKDTSLSKRAVIVHLQLAEKAYFITKKMHGFRGNKWRRTEYIATYPDQQKNIQKCGAGDAPRLWEGGYLNDTRVVTVVHHLYIKINSPYNSPIIDDISARARGSKLEKLLLVLGVDDTQAFAAIAKWEKSHTESQIILALNKALIYDAAYPLKYAEQCLAHTTPSSTGYLQELEETFDGSNAPN
jgi:hypothetical protein